MQRYRGLACFGPIYDGVSHYHKIRVLILKDYSAVKWNDEYGADAGEDNELVFDIKQMEKYILWLNRMGLSIDFPMPCNIKGKDAFIGTMPAYYIDVNTYLMNDFCGLVALNAIRYLYEGSFHKIVTKFLEFAPIKHELSLWNKFVLSHYVRSGYNNNHHTIIHCANNYGVTELASKETENHLFNDVFECSNVRQQLKKLNCDDPATLVEAINKDLDSAFNTYSKLYDNGRIDEDEEDPF